MVGPGCVVGVHGDGCGSGSVAGRVVLWADEGGVRRLGDVLQTEHYQTKAFLQ